MALCMPSVLPADQLDGDFTQATTREGSQIAHDISSYSFVALAKAGRELLAARQRLTVDFNL